MTVFHSAAAGIKLEMSFRPVWKSVGKWLGIVMLGLIYFPLLWLVLLSISRDPLSGIPGAFSLTHYKSLFDSDAWHMPMAASLAIATIVGLVSAVTATIIGRAVPQMRNPGRILAVFVLPLFVPGMSMGAALFLFSRVVLGLDLGFWSIAIGHYVWALPFSLLIVLVLTLRFDQSLIEAGKDIGASDWQIFRDIEFPLLMPGIVSAGLFGFLMSFNEVMRTIFLRGTAETMPVWNWIQASAQQSQVPVIFSLSSIILLLTLPILAGTFWLLFARLNKN